MNKVSENPLKNREAYNNALIIAVALFVTLYLVSNIMAVKVVNFFGLFYFDAGTITFPFAYMLGDVITEIWGFKTAKRIIWITFLCNIILILCTTIGVYLPYPDYLQESAQAYETVFTYVPRIIFGSLAGFLLGELSNAWLMKKIKEITKGKRLWVRTIGSSAIAHILDSLAFVLISFAGTLSLKDLLLMLLFQYISKLLIEIIFGTPMAYAAIKTLSKKLQK